MSFDSEKHLRHSALVNRCRACRVCDGVTNTGDKEYPSPWGHLAGNLDARVVIVGQDFSASERENGPTLTPDPDIPTNRNLLQLMAAAGLRAQDVYLTNAMLCLKPGKQLNGQTKAAWFHACRPLLRETIDTVAPEAVVALGARAWDSVQRAFGLAPIKLRISVEGGPRDVANGPALHGRYHCGGLGLVTRPLHRQVRDWQRLFATRSDAVPVDVRA